MLDAETGYRLPPEPTAAEFASLEAQDYAQAQASKRIAAAVAELKAAALEADQVNLDPPRGYDWCNVVEVCNDIGEGA